MTSGLPLKYTDHVIERVRLERHRTITPDPNPIPRLRIWKWWPWR